MLESFYDSKLQFLEFSLVQRTKKGVKKYVTLDIHIYDTTNI